MVAIVWQLTKARATSYLSCKNDSGGQAWLMTSGTASENVVSVRNLSPPTCGPIEAPGL